MPPAASASSRLARLASRRAESLRFVRVESRASAGPGGRTFIQATASNWGHRLPLLRMKRRERSSHDPEEQPSKNPDAEGDERPPQGRGGGQREADAGEEKDVAGNARGALGHECQRDDRNRPLDQRCGAAPPRSKRCGGSGVRRRCRGARDDRRCGRGAVRTAAGHGRPRSRTVARGLPATRDGKRKCHQGLFGLCTWRRETVSGEVVR